MRQYLGYFFYQKPPAKMFLFLPTRRIIIHKIEYKKIKTLPEFITPYKRKHKINYGLPLPVEKPKINNNYFIILQ